MSITLIPSGPSKPRKKKHDIEHEGEEEGDMIFRCLRHNGCVYHDVFISYRVNTEKKIADKLALLLDTYTKSNGKKIRTFLDSNCLLDGGNWEKNFLSALHHSKLVVLLLSEAGLDLASFSAPGLTKIQNAGNEQDNCLLEYEKTIKLHEEGRVEILVLCVSQDGKLGDRSCKIKFPTTPERIEARLQMYKETGPHKHRNGEQGPDVQETMSKLLGLLAPSQSAPNYAHLDPDDISSRITDILWKLNEVEARYPLSQKLFMAFQDVSYVSVKLFGILLGMILPIVSLLFTIGARTPRQKSLTYGILLGHSFDCFGLAFWLLYTSVTSVPKACKSYDTCLVQNAEALARNHYDILDIFCDDYQCTTAWSSDCQNCFCNGWWYYCSDLESQQDGDLLLGIMFTIFCVGLFSYAHYILAKLGVKKYRTRGGV